MKQIHLYIVSVVLLVFSACGNDNDELPGGDDNTPSAALRIEVSASDFTHVGSADTRATDSGSRTAFENGDRMGIIVLDKDGEILSDNIPYIYNSSAWSFDSNSSEGKVAVNYNNRAKTYLAYFPYTKQADGIKSIDDLKAKLQPLSDQRGKEAYRASDLLVWSQTYETSPKVLTIAFEHAYCLLSFPSSVSVSCNINGASTATTYESNWISDVSFTLNGNPYSAYKAADGSYWIITTPQSMTTSDRWLVTYRAKTYSGSMSATTLAAQTRYTLAPSLSFGDYSLDKAKVGDFYCKDASGNGYLIPGDASLDQNTACIGIVCCTDANRIGEAAKTALSGKSVTTPHGLVMALTNASEGCRWGDNYKDENSDGSDGTPFKDNTDKLNKQYNNVNGYAETRWIINTYGSSGTTLQDTYTAFYHAQRYGTADSGTSGYAAPDNTTGWFIPSMGQWWDILSNLGGIDLSNYQNNDRDGSAYISGAAPTAVNNMNKYLDKISGATTFSLDTYFWSSSEYNSSRACHVSFYSGGYLYLVNSNKDNTDLRVRCVLAF